MKASIAEAESEHRLMCCCICGDGSPTMVRRLLRGLLSRNARRGPPRRLRLLCLPLLHQPLAVPVDPLHRCQDSASLQRLHRHCQAASAVLAWRPYLHASEHTPGIQFWQAGCGSTTSKQIRRCISSTLWVGVRGVICIIEISATLVHAVPVAAYIHSSPAAAAFLPCPRPPPTS